MIILAIIFAYLIGAMPTGYIFGRIFKGVDIRNHGSGNTGAANVFRVMGPVLGILALIIDIAKGFCAVFFIGNLFYRYGVVLDYDLYRIIIAAAAIAGHNWTIFLKFKGGKGVAVSAGALIAMDPIVVGIGLIIFGILFGITRYVSAGSIAASISLPIAALILNRPFWIVAFCVLTASAAVYRHKANIGRLIRGEEKRIR